MSITRVTDKTVFAAGQLVCVQTTGECISYPVPIVRLVGSKLCLLASGQEKVKMRKSIAYIVDTEKEGIALSDMIYDRLREREARISEATARIRREIDEKWQPKINALLRGDPPTDDLT